MLKPRSCDIFCTVVDNFGDIGVCWRLACDLATRGLRVRLWVDDASALQWMAPAGQAGVTVLAWRNPLDLPAADLAAHPCELLIEAFGCEVAPEFVLACAVAAQATGLQPVWINLEYLSAEAYVERSHALPSLLRAGPAAGWTKWFFYPGFTTLTGGLLREPDLQARQAGFDRDDWLTKHGIACDGERLVSLFCYEPPALPSLLRHLAEQGLDGQAARLLVSAGRASQAVKKAIERSSSEGPGLGRRIDGAGLLSISYLAPLTQTEFDGLLWACDFNFVRGEDSLVRALWAGKPFVWQIYPQHDDAHQAKLQAFLDRMQFPPSLQALHARWNALAEPGPGDAAFAGLADRAVGQAWQQAAKAARARLMAQEDLAGQLLSFAAKNR